jgi:hypothetical protein
MRIKYLLIISVTAICCSCNNSKTNSISVSKNDSTQVKTPAPALDELGIIKTIAGKYYVPVNSEKSNFIFTINQNLNLQFLNYDGNYEGKVADGKIQFDDKDATKIEFTLKDTILTLKNGNDVALQFVPAKDKDLIMGKWLRQGLSGANYITITKDNFQDDLYGGNGKYNSKGNSNFIVPSFYDGLSNNVVKLILDNPQQITVSRKLMNGSWEKPVATRTKRKKMESLNAMFN